MPWSYQGTTISQPGVIAVIDNSGIQNSYQQSNRELVLIGSAGGGQPKTVLSFSDAQTAINTLQSGNGLTAVLRALRPAKDPSILPGTVKFIRVDPATQSTLNLMNGNTVVLQLTSVNYGQFTNQISTQIQAGSIQGLKATLTLGTNVISQDNIYLAAISIQYTGSQASGLVTVSNAQGQIQGLAGPAGSETVQWTASFSTYTTVQQIINFINAQPGWVATLLNGNANANSANYFDDATSQPCKTSPFTVTATLNALLNFYNTSNIVTAVRPNNVGLLPSIMSTPAFFSGGSNGTPTNNDWALALQALQNETTARILVPLTDQSTIHAMIDAHCQAMSQPNQLKNRVQICGGALGETVSQVITRAQNLNSRRTTLVWPGIQDIDPITQQLTTYAPWMAAVQAGAILSSLPITAALTNQALACRGLEGTLQATLQNSDYDNLVNNGVMPIKFKTSARLGNSYIFVHSVTTWQVDTKLVNTELSCVCNEDYVAVSVGNDVNDYLVGLAGSPAGLGRVISTIDGTLRRLYDEGAIVGDSLNTAYGGITATLSNGVVTGSYWAVIPAPMNFFGITADFNLYSKTASSGAA
jgi:hypothetical protein